jgi:hypothetical protein
VPIGAPHLTRYAEVGTRTASTRFLPNPRPANYNRHVMLDTYLVRENTTVIAKGDGEPLDVSAATNRVLLLTLRISDFVEQESIDVWIFGSADGATWDGKPVLSFPQKFYRGETPMLLDLSTRPEIKFVRAHWEVNRWGRGSEEPMFVFDVKLREVPDDILAEVRKEAKDF